jgi:hypothetical protein
MDAKRLVSCTIIFATLYLGACRSNTDSRSPAMTPQDSLNSHQLALSSVDCNALNREYAMAVSEASACNPANWPPKQCPLLVEQSLECGCFTYVNLRNREAVTKLRAVRNAWDASVCSRGDYPCLSIVCGDRSQMQASHGECAASPLSSQPEPNNGVCRPVF